MLKRCRVLRAWKEIMRRAYREIGVIGETRERDIGQRLIQTPTHDTNVTGLMDLIGQVICSVYSKQCLG